MEEIPEDVMLCARNLWTSAMGEAKPGDVVSSVNLISRAILAERERCAAIADVVADQKDVMAIYADEKSNFAAYREGERTAKAISAAIRGSQ